MPNKKNNVISIHVRNRTVTLKESPDPLSSDEVVLDSLSFLVESMAKNGINIDARTSEHEIKAVVSSIQNLIEKSTGSPNRKVAIA